MMPTDRRDSDMTEKAEYVLILADSIRLFQPDGSPRSFIQAAESAIERLRDFGYEVRQIDGDVTP